MKIDTQRAPTLLAAAICSGLFACATAPAPNAPPLSNVAGLRPGSEKTGKPASASPTVNERLIERVSPDADFRAERPQPGPEPAFSIPKVKRFKLSSGLPVILSSDNRLPLVNVQLVVKTGALADPTGLAGQADLAADLLDEGTTTRSALQISGEIEQLGASLSTSADWDFTAVTVSGLTEVMGRALVVWADVIMNPVFADNEVARVKENRMASLERRKDSPPALATLTFGRAVFGEKHPLGWPQDGTQETLPKLTSKELKAFHSDFFKPDNAVLVVAGDMDEAGVRAMIEPLLKTWKGKAKKPRAVANAKPLAKTTIFLVDKAGAPQSSIRIGLPALPRKHPDYYKARVMNEILGGSFRRLSLNLREQKGWTYGVYSRFNPNKIPGPWVVGGEFVADKTAPSVQEILQEVKTIREVDVPANELQEAKDALVRAFPAYFATTKQVAGQMAGLAIYDLPIDELESYQKKMAAVTVKDVKAMAQKYLQSDHLAIVIVGDKASNQEALSKIADVQLRDTDGNAVN